MTIDELEIKTAQAVRAYLVCGSENENAQRLRDLCSFLAGLLSRWLDDDPRWHSYWWIDAITAQPESVNSTGPLEVNGLAIWAQGTNPEKVYWDPFSALFQLNQSPRGLASYQLLFGDAEKGLGKVPYNTHPRGWNWSPPQSWLFNFKKEWGHQ